MGGKYLEQGHCNELGAQPGASMAVLSMVLEHMGGGAALADSGGSFLHVNRRFSALLGVDRESLRGKRIYDVAAEPSVAAWQASWADAVGGDRQWMRMRLPGGSGRVLESDLELAHFVHAGQRYCLLRLAAVESPVPGQGAEAGASPGATQGLSHDLGDHRAEVGNPKGPPDAWASLPTAVADDPKGWYEGVQLSAQTATEMWRSGSLGALPNRAQLEEQLCRLIACGASGGKGTGLLILDIDRFRDVNDARGYGAGSKVLVKFAERIQVLLGEGATVAYLGSDEFAVLLRELSDKDDAARIARRVHDALEVPFLINEENIFISASIGIAAYPDDAQTAFELLHHADAALNDARRGGRGRYCLYSSELTERARSRAMLEMGLRVAESRGELEAHFQPKIDLFTREVVGAEALLRWRHPTQGWIPPGRFVPVAEDTGLIVSIGMWILTKACEAVGLWNRSRARPLKVAVNVSPRQFAEGDLVAAVRQVLLSTACEPQWLEFEITESLFAEDHEKVLGAMLALRRMGISIAIDDFGTGYSALAYLMRFPVDTLKIDRSFVAEITPERGSTALVKAIIAMGHSLGTSLVAEGIETETQAEFLCANGCRYGQGFLFGQPVSLAGFRCG